MPRVFIGIFCPSFIIQYLSPILDTLNNIPNCQVTPKENIHITLHFMGETPQENIPHIIEKTQSILKNYTAFQITIENIKTFGHRIIYLEANNPTLIKIAEDLATSLGILDHHPKTIPHITIARQKLSFAPTNPELLTFLKTNHTTQIGTFTPTTISLIQSTLTPTGPHYSVLHEFPLKP